VKIKTVISNYIWPENLPPLVAKTIKKELSIPNPAYEDAVKFKRKVYGISKYIRPYVEENGKLGIPRGYLNRYLQILNKEGLEIDLVWNTTLYDKKEMKGLELREYQKPWVDVMLSEFQGVGQAPPGAGKTIAALEMYLRIGQPCLWLTHTIGLAEQVAERLFEFSGEEAGFIGAGKVDIKHFTVGIIPTLCRRDLSDYKDLFGMVIVDEAHHVPAATFFDVTSSFNAHYRFGLTATPYREDGLQDILFLTMGPIVTTISKQYLRDIGMLMTPTVIRRPTNFDFPYNNRVKKFNYKALEKALGADLTRNEVIATDVIVEATINNNICIVLVGTIDHGEEMMRILSDIIPDIGLIHSKQTPKFRKKVRVKFGNGELSVLIATYKMLAEGFDYKPTNRLFLTAPFKGRILIEQACGRIERISEGKKDAIVYDYVDNNLRVLKEQSEVRMDVYEASNNNVITMKI
jgi:superfamily II DNA or RNA helicase